MFQYTHELVLNNPVASVSASQCKDYITGADVKGLVIERGGEYRADLMNGVKVYVTAGYAGVLDKITLDVAALSLEAGKRYAFSMFVKLVDPHALFEYGYPNYNSFGKQILGDFVASGVAADDAKEILGCILPAALENDLSFVKDAGSASGNVVLEVGHYGLRFDSFAYAEYDTTACDSCIGDYLEPIVLLNNSDWANADAALAHTAEGKDPFATGEWLIENLRFPSYPNIRFNAIGKDNYPIASQLYSMVSFEYASPRPGLGGLSGVGQKLEAATRHIYYVPSSEVDAFVANFVALGAVKEVVA
jgi:hypothetical protein